MGDGGNRFLPGYLALAESGVLARRAEQARRHLEDCDLCARYCYVNRLKSVRGAVCRTGERAVVHSHGPHHGEEPPLRGHRGSGTIFFSWCNLRCDFCQNWEISRKGRGVERDPEQLAEMMLALQAMGCHNINLVTPEHVAPQVVEALAIAVPRGLRLPVVAVAGEELRREAVADRVVIEVKAAPDYAERLQEAVAQFPVLRTRNSKYVGSLQTALLC